MLVIFLFMKARSSRRVCLILALCAMTTGLFHCGIRTILQPEVRIVFADVGQGDATLILMKNGQSVLIDSGGKKSGVKVIHQMLDYYAIARPSIYIATHTHEDHCGAMIDIMEKRGGNTLLVPFGTIQRIEESKPDEKTSENGYLPDHGQRTGESDYALDLAAMAEEKGIEMKEIGAGDVIVLNEKCCITLYNPSKDGEAKDNASSMIIKVTYDDQNVLITGDADGETEQKLADSGADITSNIFRISHHGSPYSTNHDIISAVSPKVSIISVGTNFYGHPSPKVIECLEAAGSIVYRTDTNGAILVEMDDEGSHIKAMIP
jgi:competence protein ComEC